MQPSAGVVTLALSPFVPAAALLGARFRAESSCLLPDPNGNLDPEAPSPANMGRRRSRAVLYQLSGHYKPDKTKSKLKLNNVSKVMRKLFNRGDITLNLFSFDALRAENYDFYFIKFHTFVISEPPTFIRSSVTRIQNVSHKKVKIYYLTLWSL